MAKKKKPASKKQPAPRAPQAAAPRAEAPATPRPRVNDTPSVVPKGAWVKWSRRQWKVLDEQSARYGIPLAGETVDLAAVALWIHDLLATHGRRILAGDAAAEIYDDDPEGPASPALERKREVEYQLRLRDLAERDGQLVSRDKVREGLTAVVSVLRHYGDQVQRQFGADALDLLNDTLADCERAIDGLFPGERSEENHEDAKGE